MLHPIGAVCVKVAIRTGRPVLEVWRQSFALTIYTFWHLQQWEARDAFNHALEQHDLATLLSFAEHAPKELPGLRSAFLAEHTIISQSDGDHRRAVLRAHLAAHNRLRQISADAAGVPPEVVP